MKHHHKTGFAERNFYNLAWQLQLVVNLGYFRVGLKGFNITWWNVPLFVLLWCSLEGCPPRGALFHAPWQWLLAHERSRFELIFSLSRHASTPPDTTFTTSHWTLQYTQTRLTTTLITPGEDGDTTYILDILKELIFKEKKKLYLDVALSWKKRFRKTWKYRINRPLG